jgi:crotonobetainyl-CoA:carnitine CoA-transferase CaiB-like acyl-CoA transferase
MQPLSAPYQSIRLPVSRRDEMADAAPNPPETDGWTQGPDLVVIEMGSLIAGPFAGQMLGDLGAQSAAASITSFGRR